MIMKAFQPMAKNINVQTAYIIPSIDITPRDTHVDMTTPTLYAVNNSMIQSFNVLGPPNILQFRKGKTPFFQLSAVNMVTKAVRIVLTIRYTI
jgi:hypothetical protein